MSANTPAIDWPSHIKRQQELGISVEEYARQNKISKTQFYSWRGRLPDEGATSSTGAAGGFMPIVLAPAARRILNISFAADGSVTVSGASPAQLGRLLTALVGS